METPKQREELMTNRGMSNLETIFYKKLKEMGGGVKTQ